MKDATGIMKRHQANPLLKVEDYPGIAQLYNPSPVLYKDETILLISVVEHAALHGRGRDFGQTRIARSKNGINFTLSDKNFIEMGTDEYPYNIVNHHFIDNRVTKIDDTYYIISPVMCMGGFDSPVGVLGRTKDFESYERLDIITHPRNRGASLFSEKINGKYYKLDRPGGGDGSTGEIWLSSSPDLIHWGCFRPILVGGYRYWNLNKMGPTPPIKTEKGWLDIIHGVFTPAGGTYYYIGAILLDLDEPWKVIGKTNSYLMMPHEDYERFGNCNFTIFPCGAIAKYEKDELWLYYGATDDKICLAIGCLSEIVDACIKGI